MKPKKKKKKFKVTATTPEARALQKKLDSPKVQEWSVGAAGGKKAILQAGMEMLRRSSAKDRLDTALDAGETTTDNKKPPTVKGKRIKVKRRPKGHA